MKTETQTQTKHTPGPWYATTCGTDIHVQSASINEDNYVCKVYGTLNDDANAALIAAAPALLEALEQAVILLHHAWEDPALLHSQLADETAATMTEALAQAKNLPTGN